MQSAEPTNLPSLVPEQVRAARLAAGYRFIRGASKAAGLNFRTVKFYERADLMPKELNFRVLLALAETYRVPVSAFFEGLDTDLLAPAAQPVADQP